MTPIPLHPARQIRAAVSADVYEFEGSISDLDLAWIAYRAFRYGSPSKVLRCGRVTFEVLDPWTAYANDGGARSHVLATSFGDLALMLDLTLAEDEALLDDPRMDPGTAPRAFAVLRGVRAAEKQEVVR